MDIWVQKKPGCVWTRPQRTRSLDWMNPDCDGCPRCSIQICYCQCADDEKWGQSKRLKMFISDSKEITILFTFIDIFFIDQNTFEWMNPDYGDFSRCFLCTVFVFVKMVMLKNEVKVNYWKCFFRYFRKKLIDFFFLLITINSLGLHGEACTPAAIKSIFNLHSSFPLHLTFIKTQSILFSLHCFFVFILLFKKIKTQQGRSGRIEFIGFI